MHIMQIWTYDRGYGSGPNVRNQEHLHKKNLRIVCWGEDNLYGIVCGRSWRRRRKPPTRLPGTGSQGTDEQAPGLLHHPLRLPRLLLGGTLTSSLLHDHIHFISLIRVPDPWRFQRDPGIRTTEWRIWILLFSLVAFKMLWKNKFFLSFLFITYF